jgi:hypothetical protein
MDYCLKAGKTTLEVLQAAVKFAPVPFAKEALEVVLTLINICEVCNTDD